MATAVWPSQGTTLSVAEIIANNTFTLINLITSLTDVDTQTVTQARTSSLTTTVHTYRPTIADPGEVVADIWYDPTDLVHCFIRDTVQNAYTQVFPYSWKAIWNTTNAAQQLFVGSVAEWNGGNAADVEDNLAASFTIKKSGPQTPTPA